RMTARSQRTGRPRAWHRGIRPAAAPAEHRRPSPRSALAAARGSPWLLHPRTATVVIAAGVALIAVLRALLQPLLELVQIALIRLGRLLLVALLALAPRRVLRLLLLLLLQAVLELVERLLHVAIRVGGLLLRLLAVALLGGLQRDLQRLG